MPAGLVLLAVVAGGCSTDSPPGLAASQKGEPGASATPPATQEPARTGPTPPKAEPPPPDFEQPDDSGWGMAAGLRYLEVVKGTDRTDVKLPMVVLIHGMGDKPHDGWVQGATVPMRVILPQAPTPHGSGFSWFPYRPEDANSDQLASSLRAAAAQLDRMIALVQKHRPTLGGPTVGGFSQGAMLSYALAMEQPSRFHAVIPVSGALPKSMWRTSGDLDFPGPPIFALHGTADQIVPIAPARKLIEYLKSGGREAELKEYAGAKHEITEAMGNDFGAILDRMVRETIGLGEPPPESPGRGRAAWLRDIRALGKIDNEDVLGIRAAILLGYLDLSEDARDPRITNAIARALGRLALARQGGALHQAVAMAITHNEYGPSLCGYYQVLTKAAGGYQWYEHGEFSNMEARPLARCVGTTLTREQWESVTGLKWDSYRPSWPMDQLISELEKNLGAGDPAERCEGLLAVTENMGKGHGLPGDDFIKYLACRVTQHQHPEPDSAVECLFQKYRPDGGHANYYGSYSRLVRQLRDMGVPADDPAICMNAMLEWSRLGRRMKVESQERLAEDVARRAKE